METDDVMMCATAEAQRRNDPPEKNHGRGLSSPAIFERGISAAQKYSYKKPSRCTYDMYTI